MADEREPTYRELEMQRAFANQLRRPELSFEPQSGSERATFRYGPLSVQPQLEMNKEFATYGGDVGLNIPLGKNTSLDLSAGGTTGRGYGAAKGSKMEPQYRGRATFRHEF